jgi:hypothetical protein
MDQQLIRELRRERTRIKSELSKQLRRLDALLEVVKVSHTYNNGQPRKKRRLSAKSRAKLAASQKARWAKMKPA